MPAPPPAEDLRAELSYAVAYAEAVRALEAQRRRLESVRTRAGLVVSAGAITTSFFGAQALGEGSVTLVSWIALAAFVLLCGASLAVLWPLEWDGTISANALVTEYIEADVAASAGELQRDLALYIDADYRQNLRIQIRAEIAFRIACMLFSLQTLTWLVNLTI